MRKLHITGPAGDSAVLLDADFDDLFARVGGRRTVIITDENVARHHGHHWNHLPCLTVAPGEGSKTLDSAKNLLRTLLDMDLDRESLLVGIGGGVITDLTGFLGSVLFRGIDFAFGATTVLAQVDAAIGGKNGVNLDGYKNMVGVIRQPLFVANLTATLDTLPEQETVAGMAEVIKSGLIGDRALFAHLEEAARSGDPYGAVDMGYAVSAAAAVKVSVVNEDVFEKGPRRHLNLGHTLGHAVEKLCGLPHGYAVAVGTAFAARLSQRLGLVSADHVRRIEAVLRAFALPCDASFEVEAAMDAIVRDKKRAADTVRFVLLSDIGTAQTRPIPFGELEELLRDLCQPA